MLIFLYIPLSLVIIYAFNASGTQVWPPAGFSLRWVQEAAAEHRPAGRVPHVRRRRSGGNRGGGGPGLADRARRIAPSLLWARDDLIPRAVADRVARRRHRHGAVDHHVNLRLRARLHCHRHRPRHVLRSARLQQRCRPYAARVGIARGGLRGPGRALVPDLPVRDASCDEDGNPGRRASGVRALVRRGDRDHLRVRWRGDAPDLDLQELPARQPGSRSSTWPAWWRSCCQSSRSTSRRA